MESVLFVLIQTKKGTIPERKEIFSTIRAVDHPANYGLVAHYVFKDYTSAVELEPNHTYTVEVRHPQVVLKCET